MRKESRGQIVQASAAVIAYHAGDQCRVLGKAWHVSPAAIGDAVAKALPACIRQPAIMLADVRDGFVNKLRLLISSSEAFLEIARRSRTRRGEG